jgi:AraC-like DNA-binding protein
VGVIVDTSVVAPDERFELWSESSKRVFEPMVVESDRPEGFLGRAWRYPLGPLTVYRVAADASAIHRTPATISASDPERMQVSLQVRGHCAVRQDGRSTVVASGDWTTWESSRPYTVHALTGFELLNVHCPAALLRPHVERATGRTALRVPGDQGIGRVAGIFVAGLVAELDRGTVGADHAALAETLLDLVRGLCIAGDGREQPVTRSPDVLRAQIRSFIDLHLGDSRLGPDAIAAAHFISRSYLDRLFESEGTSVGETIRSRRLDRCRRDLCDPALAGDSILEIASRWGFVSASHFSRTFRAAYGRSPREFRREGAA